MNHIIYVCYLPLSPDRHFFCLLYHLPKTEQCLTQYWHSISDFWVNESIVSLVGIMSLDIHTTEKSRVATQGRYLEI